MNTTIIVMLVSAFWGMLGGVVWWSIPPNPKGSKAFAERLAAGFAAGALTNALSAITPFDASGSWDGTGIVKLVVAGFIGLAAVAQLPGFDKALDQKTLDLMKKAGMPT